MSDVLVLEQTEPCPNCGKIAGWWSGLKRDSMVLFLPTGEKSEERLYYKASRQCANCDHDITTQTMRRPAKSITALRKTLGARIT